MCELAVFLSGHLPKGLLKQPFNLVYCLHILEVLCNSTLASSSFWSACFCMILPTSKNKSTENLGIMGHFPSSSYGLGISYRLLQAPFCGFSSKRRFRVYFCSKNGTQNLKGVQKEHMQLNKNPSRKRKRFSVNLPSKCLRYERKKGIT